MQNSSYPQHIPIYPLKNVKFYAMRTRVFGREGANYKIKLMPPPPGECTRYVHWGSGQQQRVGGLRYYDNMSFFPGGKEIHIFAENGHVFVYFLDGLFAQASKMNIIIHDYTQQLMDGNTGNRGNTCLSGLLVTFPQFCHWGISQLAYLACSLL